MTTEFIHNLYNPSYSNLIFDHSSTISSSYSLPLCGVCSSSSSISSIESIFSWIVSALSVIPWVNCSFIYDRILGIWTSLSWSLSILVCWMCSRRKMSLNLFLTWDSVLPDIMLAISLHLLPCFNHCSRNCWSSLRVHWLFLIVGSIAVSHLSLHCLPFLAVICIWLKLPDACYISTN